MVGVPAQFGTEECMWLRGRSTVAERGVFPCVFGPHIPELPGPKQGCSQTTRCEEATAGATRPSCNKCVVYKGYRDGSAPVLLQVCMADADGVKSAPVVLRCIGFRCIRFRCIRMCTFHQFAVGMCAQLVCCIGGSVPWSSQCSGVGLWS